MGVVKPLVFVCWENLTLAPEVRSQNTFAHYLGTWNRLPTRLHVLCHYHRPFPLCSAREEIGRGAKGRNGERLSLILYFFSQLLGVDMVRPAEKTNWEMLPGVFK